MVVELSDSLHLTAFPVALVSPSILVVELAEAVLESVEFEALVPTALLVLLYDELAFLAGPSGGFIVN